MIMNIFENRRLAVCTISSIWLRHPFIISCDDAIKRNDMTLQLLDFVPNYRQLVVSGSVPKAIEFSVKKPKVLDGSDLTTLKESLFSSFQEERVGTQPIQLILFNSTIQIFKEILCHIQQGWFATTDLTFTEIGALCEIHDLETIDDCSILFLNTKHDSTIEERLFDKAERRPTEVAPFIFQQKMSEVNLIGHAILQEIEAGKSLTLVEIEELFDIDESTAKRTLALLQSEAKMDVRPYILFTPNDVQKTLEKLVEFNNVLIAGAFEKNRLIGLIKNKEFNFSVSNLFNKLMNAFERAQFIYDFGAQCRFAVELKDGRKFLLLSDHQLTYAFFCDSLANVDVLTDEISSYLQSS